MIRHTFSDPHKELYMLTMAASIQDVPSRLRQTNVWSRWAIKQIVHWPKQDQLAFNIFGLSRSGQLDRGRESQH